MKKLIVLLLCCGVGFLMSCREQTTVEDVVNMMTEASGGAEALEALTDQVITMQITMHVGIPEGVEGPMTMPMTMTAKRPNKIRWDVYGPEGSIVYSSCYDGTTGWMMEAGRRKPMTEAQLQGIESMATTFFDGFLNYKDKGFTLELLADELVDEQNFMVLQVTDKHGNVKKHYINPETHFIERESGNMDNSAGEWEPMVMTYKDYKMVDGIAFPGYGAQHNATGEMTMEFTFKELKYNIGMDDAVFMVDDAVLMAEAMSLGKWHDGSQDLVIWYVCERSDNNGCREEGWSAFGGSCYAVSDTRKTYDDAVSACEALGAKLVSIESAEENAYVQELCDRRTCWIGLTESPDSENWFWADGTAAGTNGEWSGYTNWEKGEPNNYDGRDEDVAFMNFWGHLNMPEPWSTK